MNNPGIRQEIWVDLRKKWKRLISEGHTLKVEFNVVTSPSDSSKVFAIDVAQNIDGAWFVQTIQKQLKEAYPAIGIEGKNLEQLLPLTNDLVQSMTEPALARKPRDDDEIHLFLRRISPESAETHGYVLTSKGERIEARANYRHYYVANEILEQVSDIMQEEYSEIQLHRGKDNHGRPYYRFVRHE